MCLKFILAEGPREKASLVLSALQINDERALELGFSEDQDSTRCKRPALQNGSATYMA